MALGSRSALEASHTHDREVLPMAVLAAVVLAALLLEDQDLLGPLVAHDLADDAHPRDQRLADLAPAVARGEQHLFEGERRAGLAGELLEANRVARAHSILLTAGTDDRVLHGNRDRYATGQRLSTRRSQSPFPLNSSPSKTVRLVNVA